MKPPDDVEKFLSEEKEFDERRQALVDALLKQKAEAIKEFDVRLAKLGYSGDGAKSHRSHHRKGASRPAEKAKE